MVKTKKVVEKTTTSVQTKTLQLKDYPKSFYKYDLFTKGVSTKTSAIYILILLATLAIINMIKTLTNYVSIPISQSLSVSLLGIPFLLFIAYVAFNIVLNAFENNRKPFIESFLVFASMGLQYIVIGHILALIQLFIYNATLNFVLNSLLWFVMIYFIVTFIINFKNYYKTTWQRVFVSFFLINVIIGVFSIVYYFQMLLLTAGI